MSTLPKFYEPRDAGTTNIDTKQVNKYLDFKSTEGVFSAGRKVNFFNGKTKVAEIADLPLTGSNVSGQEKSVRLTLNGSDFALYVGCTLLAECTLFNEGDVEVIFKLEVV